MQLLITERKYKTKTGEIKIYKHAKIVHGYRENGKIKWKLIKNLGSIKTNEDEIRARQVLQKLKNEETILSLSEIELEDTLEFGLIYAAKEYLQKTGIEASIRKIFEKENKQFDLYKTLLYAGVNRLYEPGSDRNFIKWLEKAWIDEDIESQHVYRMLDVIEKRKNEIERTIYDQLKQRKEIKTDLVFYDLTSSYFEGSKSELVKFGYSRDNRPDRKQIVVGVVLADGLPIAHYIFEGNTVDKKTLKQTVKDLKNRFNLRNIVFVADRGLTTIDNLEELEQNGYEYILATKRRNEKLVKELLIKPIDGKDKICVKEVYREEKKRYVLCLNKEVRKVELEKLRELRKKLEKFLTENKDRKDLKIRAYSKFGRAIKFIDFKNRKIDENMWNYENRIAGRFLLVTTTSLKSVEVLESYKELKEVEEFFRDLKHFVDVRPIYHQKDRRIKAHVFVCVFSLLIKRLLERKINPCDIEKLKRIKISVLSIGSEEQYMVKRLDEQDKKIFDLLGIEKPGKFI